jgi:RNA polymerase primary sigma factor
MAPQTSERATEPLSHDPDAVRDVRPLGPGEEAALAARVAAGDAAAREALILSGLPLVAGIARGYARYGFPLDDLVSEGTLGLIRAVETFDPAGGGRLARYASFWVRQSIRQAISRDMFAVRLPAYTRSLLARWQRAQFALACALERPPADEEVAAAAGFGRAHLERVRQLLAARALTRPAAATSRPQAVDAVADGSAGGGGEGLERAEEVGRLLRLVDALADPERVTLRSRFGFDGDAPASYRQIADRIGCSHESVRLTEREAIRRLRARLAPAAATPHKPDPSR